jgi:hypothetical protein
MRNLKGVLCRNSSGVAESGSDQWNGVAVSTARLWLAVAPTTELTGWLPVAMLDHFPQS